MLSVGDIILTGYTRIREPEDCKNSDPALHAHELGHDKLNKYEYENHAKEKMETAFEGFVGQTFVGEGDTPEVRDANALDKAIKERDRRANAGRGAILDQMDKLGEKYDQLTHHGLCDNANTPDNETGVAQAIAEREKPPEASSTPATPAGDGQQQSEQPQQPEETGKKDKDYSYTPGKGPGTVRFDEEQQYLIFNEGEPTPITWSGDPLDPILGRGAVSIDPMIRIGPLDNGSIWLSDTRLRIIDSADPENTLMTAFVFEIAYIPPPRWPGSIGVIQGYLDIPPEWAGGINNTIDSPFLSNLQAASTAGEMTTFWFYPDQDLFNQNGQSLVSGTGVQGTLVLGVGIPVVASNPSPHDEAADVAQDTPLAWNPGLYAASHDVYFGTSFADVSTAERDCPLGVLVRQGLEPNTYDPGSLELGRTYCWRVDEVNGPPDYTIHRGNVWTFTVADYYVIDDFESYTYESPDLIAQTWIDGLGLYWPERVVGNGSGSIVGLVTAEGDDPFAQTEFIHSGNQSMRIGYNNSFWENSYVERRFDPPIDCNDYDALSFWGRGEATNTSGQFFVQVNDKKVVLDFDVTSPEWQQVTIPFSEFVEPLAFPFVFDFIYGIDGAGLGGSIYIDDIRLIAEP
ncbi:MAG: hypothetical protein JW955_18435 [Sedimentisphaerales bacterium]|nr:hypothetical protein [Sedimentisphaerales bacterium]